MFEVGDCLTHRRLGQIQTLGGPAEASSLDYRMEAADFIAFDLHGMDCLASRGSSQSTCETSRLIVGGDREISCRDGGLSASGSSLAHGPQIHGAASSSENQS